MVTRVSGQSQGIGLPTNPDGSIPAIIQPRSGTLAELELVEASAVAEVASDITEGGLAIMSGTGMAHMLWAKRGGTQAYQVAGSGAVAMPANVLNSHFMRVSLTKEAGVTGITGAIGAVTAGVLAGETFEIYNRTGITLTGNIPGSGVGAEIVSGIPNGWVLTLIWSGAEWLGKSLQKNIYSGVIVGIAKEIGSATATMVGYGGKTNNVLFPITFGTGEVLADYGVAMHAGTIKEKAKRAFSSGSSVARWEGTMVSASNIFGGAAYESEVYVFEYHKNITWVGYTFSATPAIMAFNGNYGAPSTLTDSNTIVGTDFNGTMFLDLLIQGYDYSGSPYKWARMARSLVLYSDGSTMSLQGAVQTVGADHLVGAGMTASAAVTVVANRLQISITGSGAEMEWSVLGNATAGVYR